MQSIAKIFGLTTLGVTMASAKTTMQMPLSTELSPDGSEIAFSWKNDIWKVSSNGGKASRVTTHPARDYRPVYSPDGRSIYFNSNREGVMQVFKKNLKEGAAQQITRHTETSILEDLSQDGKTLLLRNLRVHTGRNPMRLYTTAIDKADHEELLFDTSATGGKLSPDGSKVLFTREGVESYRKQYKGSQAGQIWLYDKASDTFVQPVKSDYGVRWPLWAADGKSFYYVSQQDKTFNLYQYDLESKKNAQLTFFKDDGVILPTISDDGTTIAFRVLFDLYVLKTAKGSKPVKINIYHNEVDHEDPLRDLTLSKTSDADFTPSGLEIAFNANDDLYVMDTVLREPVQITKTVAIEKNLTFTNKGKELYYISDDGITTSIAKVTRKDPSKYWWKSQEFEHTIVYQSADTINAFNVSPDGKKLAISLFNGKLILTDLDGKNAKTLVSGWQTIYPQWSPDSKWITYSQQDNNFNADIFIQKADGSEPAINLSQHPDNEFAPVWSPDGKKIAFMGRRFGSKYDLFVADLFPKEKSSHEKKIESAENAMKRDPAYKKKPTKPVKPTKPSEKPKAKPEEKKDSKEKTAEKPKIPAKPKAESKSTEKPKVETPKKKAEPKEPKFQLEGITQRFKRIPLKGDLQDITWASDSRRLLVQHRGSKNILAYSASGGNPATYASASGPIIRVTKSGKIYMVNNGSPAVLSGSRATNYAFRVFTQRDRREHFRMAFRMAWRTMKDGFYDTSMNNRDWSKVLEKYDEAAYNSANSESMERIVAKMLGELNASHTGFRATPWNQPYKPQSPRLRVVHLGVLFDKSYTGAGFKVSHVLKGSQATLPYSKLSVGDIITSVNEKPIEAGSSELETFLQVPSKVVHLHVTNPEGEERTLDITPSSFQSSRALANAEEIDKAEALVKKLSNNKLGYIHVERMMWNEFEKFERHLHEKGYGKDGIIIDVRNNGGGFTTDHLLTVLNQKRHAFTIPRNGGAGYPQDRIVYATWEKPIIVLCNQNSFSNAEIFTHAIKTLKRGKVVGVQTAGGVISTGSKKLPNAGNLRYPFRGWFSLENGADMEMNGAMPDITIWPTPKELTQGVDKQLEKAIEVLTSDVKNNKPLHGKAIYKSSLPQ